MTGRTDYHCPHCGRYLFSAYTLGLSDEQLYELNKEAAVSCECRIGTEPYWGSTEGDSNG